MGPRASKRRKKHEKVTKSSRNGPPKGSQNEPKIDKNGYQNRSRFLHRCFIHFVSVLQGFWVPKWSVKSITKVYKNKYRNSAKIDQKSVREPSCPKMCDINLTRKKIYKNQLFTKRTKQKNRPACTKKRLNQTLKNDQTIAQKSIKL